MKLAGLSAHISSIWLSAPRPTDLTGSTVDAAQAEDEALLEAHLSGILARAGRFFMRWGVLMLFLWWPTDLLVLRGLPHALRPFMHLRAVLLATCLLVLLYLRRRAAVSAAAQVPPVALCGATVALVAYCLGGLGGLDSPWFHFTYLVLFVSVAFPVTLPRRVAYNLWIALCLAVGYGAAAPGSARSPFMPPTVGFVLFVLVCSTLFGHLFSLLIRSNFLRGVALQRSRDLLSGYNARLSAEVAERTRELRQLSAHLDRALETERARISRELHDELGQQLTAIRYELRFLRQRFARDPASVRGNLENLDHLMARAAQAVGQVVTDLRPRLLDDLGLAAALEWLVKRMDDRGPPSCCLAVVGTPPAALPEELSTAVFRILQESLTNVARHAGAQAVQVTLRCAADALELMVRDDGVGCAGAGRPGGMGLVSMRERAAALGGALTIGPGPGGGTDVRCRLPWRTP